MQGAGAFEAFEAACSGDHLPEAVVIELRLAVFARKEDGAHGPLDVGHVAFAFGGHQVTARISRDAGDDVVPAVFNDLSAIKQARTVLEVELDLLFGGHGGLHV